MQQGITRNILDILQRQRRISKIQLTSRLLHLFASRGSAAGNPNKKISQSFSYLLSKKLIIVSIRAGTEFVALTSKGRIHARMRTPIVIITKPKSWDGRWYLVGFDIPLSLRGRAELFRRSIKALDFYQLQKSLWAYPYPCEAELSALGEHFGIRSHLRIIRADQIEGDGPLKKAFGLRS